MSALLYEIFAGWVRAALVALSTFLIQHHLVNGSQADRLTTELFTYVMMLVPGLVALAWTALQKYQARLKFLTALAAPKGTSEATLNDKIASGQAVPLAGVLLPVLLIVGLTACAHPKHVAVVTDVALYQVLNDVHVEEQHALCGRDSCVGVTPAPIPGWSLAQSQAFNRTLLPVVDAGRQFNAVLGTWKPGSPTPAKLHELITGLSGSLTQVASDFPAGDSKTKILGWIGQAQSVVLNAVDIYFSVKGAQ